jgi:hypothetical protein
VENVPITNPLAIMNAVDQQRAAAAMKAGTPFLAYRGVDRRLATHLLTQSPVTLGRSDECDICLGWDGAVSETALEFTKAGSRWRTQAVATTNRVTVQRPEDRTNRTDAEFWHLDPRQAYLLKSDDLIHVGATTLCFWAPRSRLAGTVPVNPPPPPVRTTPAERRMLVVLCRPLLEAPEDPTAHTPSNATIAGELFITERRVENLVSSLSKRFGLEDLPPGRKREALARHAIRQGIVSATSV